MTCNSQIQVAPSYARVVRLFQSTLYTPMFQVQEPPSLRTQAPPIEVRGPVPSGRGNSGLRPRGGGVRAGMRPHLPLQRHVAQGSQDRQAWGEAL